MHLLREKEVNNSVSISNENLLKIKLNHDIMFIFWEKSTKYGKHKINVVIFCEYSQNYVNKGVIFWQWSPKYGQYDIKVQTRINHWSLNNQTKNITDWYWKILNIKAKFCIQKQILKIWEN